MSHELLKGNILKHVEISESDLKLFCGHFKSVEINKKDFLLRQGNVCTYEGFVIEGCFRVFTIDEKGNEKTLYFAARDWWLMDIDSFMNQTSSNLNIQALEDSKVLLINRTDKLSLYESIPVIDKLFRVMSQKAIVAWQRRLIRNHCQTAKERLQYFLTTYPHIASKVNDKQIASYLGISHEFLSKIKRNS